MDGFLHDLSWAVALRHDALTPIFIGFTALGYTTFFLIFLPAAYWTWDKDKITRVAFVVLASALLNAFLKDLWQNPRPDMSLWIDPNMSGDTSYGLPSGHTQVGIVLWFWLAYEIRKAWAFVAAAIIAGGIAFSRLYLGVHDVEDVLGGTVIAIVTLLAYGWTFSKHFDWWRALPFAARFGALAAILVLTILVWPGGAGSSGAVAGFLLAWVLGVELDRDTIRYAPGPGWWRRLVAAVVGVAGVIFFFRALGHLQEAVAPHSAALAAINGMIIGALVVFVFPMVFQIFLLARRAPRVNTA
jgi:glycerophosphoryl diester phosphodiesterase